MTADSLADPGLVQSERGGAPALPALRWLIVGLLFFASVLNYVDKNTLSLLAPTIQHDLHFDDRTYATIQNAFQVAYTVALLGSGLIVDRFGPRISLALFVGWWSIANVLTAWAKSLGSFGIFRFMLGLGEAGNWTAAPKAVAEWFPVKERGLAIGIYAAGTPLGMTLAPLLIIWIADAHGWRGAFVFTGIVGLLWLVPWVFFYRPIKAEVVRLFQAEQAREPSLESQVDRPRMTWLNAFTQPIVWCLLLGRMLSDPVWFFYQNWYPKYLVSARHFSQKDIRLTWVIFLAAGIGSLLGGVVAGQLIRAGHTAERGRLLTMLGCAAIMPLSTMVAQAQTAQASLALASLIAFAHLAWLTNITALVVDVIPCESLGSVFGIVAAGSSLGAIAMNEVVGRLVHSGSYDAWYRVAGVLHPLAWLILWFGLSLRDSKALKESKTSL